jgi:hypothetical protein
MTTSPPRWRGVGQTGGKNRAQAKTPRIFCRSRNFTSIARVIPRLARRAIEALVALFALLGFCLVPLGEKTALEHTGAILRTGAAVEAGRELVEAASRIRRKIFEQVERAPDAPEPALVRAEPADAGAAPDASLGWKSAAR